MRADGEPRTALRRTGRAVLGVQMEAVIGKGRWWSVLCVAFTHLGVLEIAVC